MSTSIVNIQPPMVRGDSNVPQVSATHVIFSKRKMDSNSDDGGDSGYDSKEDPDDSVILSATETEFLKSANFGVEGINTVDWYNIELDSSRTLEMYERRNVCKMANEKGIIAAGYFKRLPEFSIDPEVMVQWLDAYNKAFRKFRGLNSIYQKSDMVTVPQRSVAYVFFDVIMTTEARPSFLMTFDRAWVNELIYNERIDEEDAVFTGEPHAYKIYHYLITRVKQ